mmetsp:Transcript_46616/g.107673  ORF Transcript_46616/g.107673 Transcript_46616/m.107673 type:complete len:201 (-) Transcript_46616:234-836(-)
MPAFSSCSVFPGHDGSGFAGFRSPFCTRLIEHEPYLARPGCGSACVGGGQARKLAFARTSLHAAVSFLSTATGEALPPGGAPPPGGFGGGNDSPCLTCSCEKEILPAAERSKVRVVCPNVPHHLVHKHVDGAYAGHGTAFVLFLLGTGTGAAAVCAARAARGGAALAADPLAEDERGVGDIAGEVPLEVTSSSSRPSAAS